MATSKQFMLLSAKYTDDDIARQGEDGQSIGLASAEAGAEEAGAPWTTTKQTGLVYYGFRYYSPSLGRWINRDPIEERGGLNLYAAFANDPVNFIDVLGMYASNTTLIDGTQGHLGKGCEFEYEEIDLGNGFVEVVQWLHCPSAGVSEPIASKIVDDGGQYDGLDDPLGDFGGGSTSGGSGQGGGSSGTVAGPIQPTNTSNNNRSLEKPQDQQEDKEEKCSRLQSTINSIKEWYSNTFGNKAPLNDINDFFDDNPENFYANQPDPGAPAFRDPNAESPWSTIGFKEPVLTTIGQGLQYSVLRGAASPGGTDVPESLNGQYAASPSPPAYIGRTQAAIDATSGLISGQLDSQMMLSEFTFVHSNFNGGWFINDVSINSHPTYLQEGQGREILEGVFDSYGKALSEYYKSGCEE